MSSSSIQSNAAICFELLASRRSFTYRSSWYLGARTGYLDLFVIVILHRNLWRTKFNIGTCFAQWRWFGFVERHVDCPLTLLLLCVLSFGWTFSMCNRRWRIRYNRELGFSSPRSIVTKLHSSSLRLHGSQQGLPMHPPPRTYQIL